MARKKTPPEYGESLWKNLVSVEALNSLQKMVSRCRLKAKPSKKWRVDSQADGPRTEGRKGCHVETCDDLQDP